MKRFFHQNCVVVTIIESMLTRGGKIHREKQEVMAIIKRENPHKQNTSEPSHSVIIIELESKHMNKFSLCVRAYLGHLVNSMMLV